MRLLVVLLMNGDEEPFSDSRTSFLSELRLMVKLCDATEAVTRHVVLADEYGRCLTLAPVVKPFVVKWKVFVIDVCPDIRRVAIYHAVRLDDD